MRQAPPLLFLVHAAADRPIADRVVDSLLDALREEGAAPPSLSTLALPSARAPDPADVPAGSYVLWLAPPALPQEADLAAWADADSLLIGLPLPGQSAPPRTHDMLALRCPLTKDLSASRELRDFLLREEQLPLPPRATTRSSDPVALLHGATRRELRLVACHCLDEQALDEFLFDAGLPSPPAAPAPLSRRLLDLLHHAASQGLLEHFADWLMLEHGECVRHQLARLRQNPTQAASSLPSPTRCRLVLLACAPVPVDQRWLTRLLTHLRPLERQGALELWDLSRLRPGADIQAELRHVRSRCSAAVLLLSPDLFASDLLTVHLLPPLLSSAGRQSLRLVPLLVRPCHLPEAIARYHPAGCPDRTLSEMSAPEAERTLAALASSLDIPQS